MFAILINNMLREEQVARQRAPLDNKIFAELRHVAHASKCDDLANMLFRNIVTLGCYIGPRLSEYAQKNQKKVYVHTYPSGTTVIKAFTANDFIFYNAKKHIIEDLCPESIESIAAVKITWQIQKNRQNGQSITLATDKEFPDLCPVRSAIRMVIRARQLQQPDDMPLAMYKTKKGEHLYLMGGKISKLLQGAVKRIRPDTSPEDIKRYSAHSLRVWACVLLNKAGKSPDYIKKRLRWLGDSFRMYLRDTSVIQHQHVDALQTASQAVMDLLSALPEDVIALLSTMTEVSDDHWMQDYADEED